jgi:hypothetical protein
MEVLGIIFVIVFCLVPYSWFFYKEVNIRIRLLFASMASLLILCIMVTLVSFGLENLIDMTSLYGIFVSMSVLLNIALIIVSLVASRLARWL